MPFLDATPVQVSPLWVLYHFVHAAGDPTSVGDGAGGTVAVVDGGDGSEVGAQPIVVKVDVSSMTWVRFLVT